MLTTGAIFKIQKTCDYKFINLNVNISPKVGDIQSAKFQKSTKKLKFVALLKQKFYFVPRGTNVENYLLL